MDLLTASSKISPSKECIEECAIKAYQKAESRIITLNLEDDKLAKKETIRLTRFFMGVLYSNTKMNSEITANFVSETDKVCGAELNDTEDVIKAMSLVYNRYAFNAAKSARAKTNVIGKLMGTPDYSSDDAFTDSLKTMIFNKGKPLAPYLNDDLLIGLIMDYTELFLRFKRG